MSIEVKLAPMVDHRSEAGPDWFLCDGCLAYHPPEYRAEYQSNSEYKKFCFFAVAVIRDEEIPDSDTLPASIYQAQDIDVQSFVTEGLTDSTCQNIVTPEKQTIVTIGRPKADLPVDKIMELHRDGISSRNIVTLLGLKTSYRTVARVIEGQQVLV